MAKLQKMMHTTDVTVLYAARWRGESARQDLGRECEECARTLGRLRADFSDGMPRTDRAVEEMYLAIATLREGATLRVRDAAGAHDKRSSARMRT